MESAAWSFSCGWSSEGEHVNKLRGKTRRLKDWVVWGRVISARRHPVVAISCIVAIPLNIILWLLLLLLYRDV